MAEPTIGLWYYFCCEEDLRQIKDAAEASGLAENIEEGLLVPQVFKTKREALAAIRRIPVMGQQHG